MIGLLAIMMATMLDTCVDGHLICQTLFFFGNRLLVARNDDDVSKGITFIITAVEIIVVNGTLMMVYITDGMHFFPRGK